ncbi:MAG TPA: acyl-CoA dehydrogenase family protein, partial [Myxococcota bacterium]|nr:acyl-CoA dehydrogenase family protein [Myxococcota bacterium]
MTPSPGLDDARALLRGADELLARSLDAARETTANGSRIDDHQVLAEAVAYAATEGRAARELLELAAGAEAEGRATPMLVTTAAAGVADLVRSLRVRLEPHVETLGIGEAALEAAFPEPLRALLRRAAHESVFRAIGRHVAETRGRNATPLDEVSEQVRDAVREFAEREVAPHAERIHRRDELVPEEFIAKMAELGYFGL